MRLRALQLAVNGGRGMDVEVICIDDDDGEIFSQEAPEQQPSCVVDLTTSSSGLAAEPSFEEEYNVLRSSAQGFEPPLEAIAELLLRHPKHWWCRFVYGKHILVVATRTT